MAEAGHGEKELLTIHARVDTWVPALFDLGALFPRVSSDVSSLRVFSLELKLDPSCPQSLSTLQPSPARQPSPCTHTHTHAHTHKATTDTLWGFEFVREVTNF